MWTTEKQAAKNSALKRQANLCMAYILEVKNINSLFSPSYNTITKHSPLNFPKMVAYILLLVASLFSSTIHIYYLLKSVVLPTNKYFQL